MRWLENGNRGWTRSRSTSLQPCFGGTVRTMRLRRYSIQKRRKRRATALLTGGIRSWDRFLDFSVRYGWQRLAGRLMGGAAIFLLVFALVVSAQAVDLNLGPPDTTASYHPFVHALDVFLPIIDLGIESRWAIRHDKWRRVLLAGESPLWVLPVVGRISVTLAVAAFTGIHP